MLLGEVCLSNTNTTVMQIVLLYIDVQPIHFLELFGVFFFGKMKMMEFVMRE